MTPTWSPGVWVTRVWVVPAILVVNMGVVAGEHFLPFLLIVV